VDGKEGCERGSEDGERRGGRRYQGGCMKSSKWLFDVPDQGQKALGMTIVSGIMILFVTIRPLRIPWV
jgi:hypothetical protein